MSSMTAAAVGSSVWSPSDGRLFHKVFAFDCETCRIDDERPWLTPPYVLGAAADAETVVFVPRERLRAFMGAHRGVPVVFHNAPFDLAVIQTALAAEGGSLDVYDLIEQDLVRDTRILHRLLSLATEGHTGQGRGLSSLEHCAKVYAGIDLPKDGVDSRGAQVRLGYGRWLRRPVEEIETPYLDYLAMDAQATFQVFLALRKRISRVLKSSADVWGYVDDDWLRGAVCRWGFLTHHIQLKAAIVLREITANGLHLDLARRDELVVQLDREIAQQLEVLRRLHYLPGKGSSKAIQAILRRLERQLRITLPRTEKGRYSTKQADLEEFAAQSEFIRAYLAYMQAEKLKTCFVDKMAKRVLHPSFDVLKTTGRTSSFGELNAQNLPRDAAGVSLRGCFVPSAGCVFIDADYTMIEMATLSQACISQFGLESKMAAAINDGQDLHRVVAARFLRCEVDEVDSEGRRKAKAINFGKPGGMGDRSMKEYARTSYGVELNDDGVVAMSNAWFESFPEMRDFLGGDGDRGGDVAVLLGLTLRDHSESTGDERFLRRLNNESDQDRPDPILGAMALKAFREEEPTTRNGRPYPQSDVGYFWDRLDECADRLPAGLREEVRLRRPSPNLSRAVQQLADRKGVFTLTGRLRAQAGYCARHNTIFQGLAADGAKLALWRLWRAGFRIVNFIHDELLIEVPEDEHLTRAADEIRRLMVESMREVVTDVAVSVELAASRIWTKEAKETRVDGRLQVWEPLQTPPAGPGGG